MTSTSSFLRAARHAGLGAIALASLVATTGCTVGPDFKRPDKPATTGYTPENLVPKTASADVPDGGAAQTFDPAADIPGQWWELFRSTELNGLIVQALKANPDLDAAQASLRQANEQLYAQQGSLFPTISGNGSANNQRVSGASQGQAGWSVYGVTTASLSVSYTADIWGGVRRQVESSAALAEYQRYQLEATYLTLTSNVVVAAINMASLRAQITATEAIIKLETDALNLVQTQFNLGGAARTDVLQQQATLTQTQATLPPLQKQLAQQRNSLMRLLGLPPTDDAGQNLQLASLHLPENLPLSLPSQLVDQRPDVRSFEAQLHQMSANIGVAIANQLPQFSITGQLGQASAGLSNMFIPATGIWSIGFSIAQTLLDGGKLEHTKLAAIAAFDAAAAQYRGAVLSAFRDVANALRALQYDADQLAAAVAAEQVAAQSLDLSRQQYQLGATTYLQLLNAQQTYQNALLSRVQAQATRYSDTSALFQALGGGWWNRQDVNPSSKGKPGGIINVPPVQEIKLPRAGH